MNEIVRNTFRNTIASLSSELDVMPLNRWNESVFRYYFCRQLATEYPEVEQFVECKRIDLVLRHSPRFAFIEFKFYRHARRFDPYDGSPHGFKGGPGSQNLREFQKCVDELHERRSTSDLSKYVVVAYADPTDDRERRLRFSDQYDEYNHPRDDVAVQTLESSSPIQTHEEVLKARLYEIG